MSHLSEWIQAHGMTEQDAFRQSGISYATWRWLMAGYPTIPCLALDCGHNLGMTPEEVLPLGTWLHIENFLDSDLPTIYPECFDRDWNMLVTDYTPAEREESLGPSWIKRTQFCARCGKKMPYSTQLKYCPTCMTEEVNGVERNNYCVQCGKRITGTERTKFCSDKCFDAHKLPYVNRRRDECPYCGKIFTPRNAQQIYCSKECYEYAHGKRRLPEIHPLKCKRCGAMYLPRSANRQHSYCSDNCRAKARYERQKKNREEGSQSE